MTCGEMPGAKRRQMVTANAWSEFMGSAC